MICDICGRDKAVLRHVTRSYGYQADLLVIENIPAVHCPDCKENYVTADTLYEIERIKLHRQHFAKERSIPVAEFYC